MKKSLVISAHLDDAVLSAGQFIAGHPNCDVLTVFAGIPMVSAEYVTDYDKSCGFSTSKDAMVTRQQEDREACAILNANPYHSDRLDSQYTKSGDYKRLAEELKAWIAERDYEMVIGPLGLRHPDHVILAETLFQLRLPNLYLYEDLPARVTHPEHVAVRLPEVGIYPHDYVPLGDGYPEPIFIGDGPIQNKVRALWCYRSQIGRGDLNPYNLYVPERFWKV